MKYIKLFEDFDPYELMLISPHKKTQMIMDELSSGDPDLNLIETLCIMGADLDWQDEFGWTVLNYAISFNNLDICKILLKAGLDPNIKDSDGATAIHYASKKSGNIRILKLLIDFGAEVNIIDNKPGWTPLIYALHQNNIEGIKLLLKNGANLNIKYDFGYTSLHWAVLFYYRSPDMIKSLLEAGADPTIENEDGKTPLDLANEKNAIELVSLFDNYKL